jgi:hypothetical protein
MRIKVIMPAIIDQAGRPFNVDETDGVSRRHRSRGRAELGARAPTPTCPSKRTRPARAANAPGRGATPSGGGWPRRSCGCSTLGDKDVTITPCPRADSG